LLGNHIKNYNIKLQKTKQNLENLDSYKKQKGNNFYCKNILEILNTKWNWNWTEIKMPKKTICQNQNTKYVRN